jgi:putative ABC transport system permease protein
MGAGVIIFNTDDPNPAGVRAVTDRYAPQLTVDPVGTVGDGYVPGTKPHTIGWVALAPPGCNEAQIVAPYRGEVGVACGALTNDNTQFRVGELASLPAAISLSAAQRAVLKGGGILIADPRLVRDGQVSSVSGTAVVNRSGVLTGGVIARRTRLPAVVVDESNWQAASRVQPIGRAWILPKTAAELGWPVWIEKLDIASPTGTISPEVERAVADRLGDGYVMSVERGFQNPYRTILLILFLVTGLLVLIASLISTALSLTESQNDMATLAAVGATRHTRRGVAACQALVVAACGCVLGVAVGMVPGIAVTWPLTSRVLDQVTGLVVTQDPVVVIPWLNLVALCIGVPLLAAGLAWVAVRRHPQLTRRMV